MKKSCKKGHPAGSGKRWLALLLSLCLVGTMTPVSVRAEAGSTANGLCEHHTEHTPECGYAEVSGGDSCTFVCDSCGAGAEPEEAGLSGEIMELMGQAGAGDVAVMALTGFDMTGQPEDTTVKSINLNAAVLRPAEADGKKWDAANGNKVYFGSYNSNPLAYRVLSSPNTQGSSESYLLLDCDTILEQERFSSNANKKWTDSTCIVRNWLNGTDFYDASVFSTPEKTAIAETALAEQSKYTVGNNGISYEDYSAQNHVFCLSAAEADGLYANEDSRKKTGPDNSWWLRSADSNRAYAAGNVNYIGRSYSYDAGGFCGVSPALNVDLSKVLFASVSGQSASGEALDKSSALAAVSDSAAKQWKLTLLDSSKTVKVTDGQSVTRQGATVTVPYTYSGSDVTQISVMITDYPYTDRYDAQVLYYGALQDVNISNISGTGTFDLPTNLNENYFAYIIAEDVNGNTESDYASAPVQITIPASSGADPVTPDTPAVPVNGKGLGVSILADPTAPATTTDAWKGSFVYFGTYDGNPVKYRVLDRITTDFGGTTMLLDCDSILWAGTNSDSQSSRFDDDSNIWTDSEIKSYLNGTFLTKNFTALERAAIAASSKANAGAADGDGWTCSKYAALSGEQVFLLDAKEATKISYGYSNTNQEAENRKKTGGNAYWYLRSANVNDADYANMAIVVYYYGIIDNYYVGSDYIGVSPALNVNLSSVLFSSLLSGKSGQPEAVYKLTLLDDDMAIAPGTVTRNQGDEVTVSYTISGANADNATQVSLMVLDKEYEAGNTNGAELVAYERLAGAGSTAGTFTLTEEMKNGSYYYYIVAESVNAGNTTDYASDYASAPVQITIPAGTILTEISSVDIAGFEAPAVNTPLGAAASCTTTGVRSVAITWSPAASKAGYNTSYTASITLSAQEGYEFTDTTAATVLGKEATSVAMNADGTLTVTYTFPATAKDKLVSIAPPQAMTVINGTAYEAMNLPATVNIVTEGNTESSAQVTWDTITPAAGSYDPAVTTEQTVTLNGAVTCPDTIDANGAALTTTISITISAADIVGAPMADPATGIYKGKQLVTLTSPTAGAKIYYTTDGSEPAVSGGVPDGTTMEYTEPIAVRGAEGRSVVTTIKAIAVKSGMQASSVETYTYTIQIPDTTLPEVAIEIGTNRWNRFLNTVTFGHFFKDTKKVTITAADNVTSELEIRYYLSDRQLTAAEIVSAGIEWQAYTEEFNLNANCKKIIYAKATDEAHNAKIVNSEGIVVYTDPAADTTSVIYIKNVTDEVNVQVKLNGNTVVGIKNGEDELTASDYTVDGNGKITLNRVYLSTLETGEYTLTVNYNPMGENYAASNDNEACATTLFTLTVRNPKLTGITQPEAVTGVANGTAKTAAALGLPKTVTITTENPGIITAAVSWNLESLAEGSYEPSVLTEQSFKVNGTVTLPEGVDNSDNKSLTVTIQVTVKAVPGVTAPSITTQPVDAAVKEGETAVFTIAASGTDLTYQWVIDRNDGNGWVKIPGASGTGYTTSTVSLSCNGFKYQCVVSNAAGTVTSDVAVLTVSGSVAYRILDGADSEWKQNTDGTVTIRGNGEFSKFVSVRVDGTLVDEKNYTAREGSTIITLKADYLKTLSVGTHTFEIVWTDGSAETSFKVSENISGNEENRDPNSDNGSSDNHPASTSDGEQDNGNSNGNNEGNHQQITAPKTGDTSHLGVWVILLAFSVAGIIVLLYVYRKQKGE